MLGDSKGSVIHVIDDEAEIVSVVAKSLETNGYQVHSFNDSSMGLEDILVKCKEDVGIVITGIRMSGYNGFEIARKTRAMLPHVPIVFMTSFEMNPSEFEKVFPSLTNVTLLKKPFHIEKLLAIVAKYGK